MELRQFKNLSFLKCPKQIPDVTNMLTGLYLQKVIGGTENAIQAKFNQV